MFHPWEKRTTLDKDGGCRPIVVKRGFGNPWEQPDEEVPTAPAVNRPATVNPAPARPRSSQLSTTAPAGARATTAPARTTSRAVNRSVAAPRTPVQPAQTSSKEVIDLVSEDEDVQMVLGQTGFDNATSQGSTSRAQTKGKTQTTATASQAQKRRHIATPGVDNPEELGDAYHHRQSIAKLKQEAAANPGGDSSSSSSESSDDDELLRLCKNISQPRKPSTNVSPTVAVASKQAPDPSKSEIWKYLMTLTKAEIPVPNDAAIVELLSLSKRRDVPKTWQNSLKKAGGFKLTTLTGLILYLGGDEAPNSPCDQMGCSTHPEAYVFSTLDFHHGRHADHRYPFSKCVLLPSHLHNSAAIIERLGRHQCCNAYCRSWMQPGYPSGKVADGNGGSKVVQEAGGTRTMQDNTANASAGIPPSSSKLHGSKSGQVTPTTQLSHRPAPPSGPRASLPNDPRMSSEKQSEGLNNISFNRIHAQPQPHSPSTQTTPLTSKEKSQTWYGKETEKKMNKVMKFQYDEHGPARQVQDNPVLAASSRLSSLTVQDTPAPRSESPEQYSPEQPKESTIVNITDGPPKFIGVEGDKSQLLQASKKQTLECVVWAGSVNIQMVGVGGMTDSQRMEVGETWTVEPDSHCLVSSFSSAAGETAVIKVKSVSVTMSVE